MKNIPRVVDEITDVLVCCGSDSDTGGGNGVSGGNGGGVDDGDEFVSLISLAAILTVVVVRSFVNVEFTFVE